MPQIADEIHEACHPQFGTTRIKSHRLTHGIALADVIEQVRALFERDGKPVPGIGETLLSAYESGLKKPGPEYLHYLCLVYRVEPVSLGYEGPCICGQNHRQSGGRGDFSEGRAAAFSGSRGDLHYQPAGGGDPAADSSGDEEIVLRRTLLNLLMRKPADLLGQPADLMDEQVLGAIEGIRRRMDDTLVSGTVSAAMLDHWEEATTGFGRQYMNTPPLRLLCDVLLELNAVRQALERRQPMDIQDGLLRMTARLAGLSGMVMINLGDHRMARAFFRTGRTAADETGDRALRAWVTAREALVPLYYGDPREALNLAKKSRDLAGQTVCAAQAMAPVVEARALAMLAGSGKKDVIEQAKRALSRARAAFAQMSVEDQSDATFGYTEKQLYFHQGDALVKLGDTVEADNSLMRALSKYESSEWLDPTLIKFDRAKCKLLEDEVQEALTIARAAVDALQSEYRTDIVMRRAFDLMRQIEGRGGATLEGLVEFKQSLAADQADEARRAGR
ncbi:XRE family transcriptional regulator [Sinosporangium siamense]|nr:XRE family transcriptional regulator [Sinosporangium siamense]